MISQQLFSKTVFRCKIQVLNQGGLVDSYDTLLTVYTVTGIPNTKRLNKIGTYLKVDAIIQGFVIQVSQKDGNLMGGVPGETRVTFKYVMFSTVSGEVLWEATCEGHKSVSSLKKAPPMSDMMDIIREKMISELRCYR